MIEGERLDGENSVALERVEKRTTVEKEGGNKSPKDSSNEEAEEEERPRRSSITSLLRPQRTKRYEKVSFIPMKSANRYDRVSMPFPIKKSSGPQEAPRHLIPESPPRPSGPFKAKRKKEAVCPRAHDVFLLMCPPPNKPFHYR